MSFDLRTITKRQALFVLVGLSPFFIWQTFPARNIYIAATIMPVLAVIAALILVNPKMLIGLLREGI